MRLSELTGLWVCVATILFVGATSFMPAGVYSSWWWMTFWAVVGAGLCAAVVRFRLWRRPAVFALHLSFLLMLAGGAATTLTSTRGSVLLHPAVPASSFISADGDTLSLPAAITLEKFESEYYPGMIVPRDFHSYITTADGRSIHISMNRIGHLDGYRLYQSSFDGRGGSVLSVARDPVGIALTYAGYLLFALSGLWMLVRRHRAAGAAMLLLAVASSASAAPAIGVGAADSLASLQVVFNGRVVPFGVMASELTYKLTGRGAVASMSPSRFVASLIVFGDDWRKVPFIKVKGTGLRAALGADGSHVSVAQLYDARGGYKPEALFKDGTGPLDAEILKLDEKVALLAELWRGELFIPLADDSPERLGAGAVASMLAYVKWQPVRLFFIITLSLASLLLVMQLFRRRVPVVAVAWILTAAGAAIFVWRWTIVGHVPLSNAPEIMTFVAVAFCGVSALASRQAPLASSFGLLMAGFASLVAWLSFKDPALTPLMPVLASPWLAAHVSVVMVAYALLAFTLPVSVAALAVPSRRQQLVATSMKFIAPGVYLLGIGIFLGAMWANVSWGRYWAWDPKETWALVTMLLYALPLHRSLGLSSRPALFHIFVALAFLSIIMTYAGVNYLPSQHAYQ